LINPPRVHVNSVNTTGFRVNSIVQNIVAGAGDCENGVLGAELQMAQIFLWIFPGERVDECAEFRMDRGLKVRQTPRLE